MGLLYSGDSEYLDGTVPYILEGLKLDEPVAVAVPGPNLTLIEEALGDAAAEVELIDMTQAGRNPGRILPGVLLAFADTRPGPVRIIGEPIWAGRSAVEYPACAQHEALINFAFGDRELSILCPYDRNRLDDDVLADARRTHPILSGTEGDRPSEDYAPDAVVDKYNLPLPEPRRADTFRFDLGRLSAVRHFVQICAEENGLGPGRVEDLVLAVAELSANSVLHGSGHGVVRVWSDGDYLLCEVIDEGTLSDPLAGRRPATPGQIGGRGLVLVNEVADLVRQYRRPGSTVTRIFFRV
ncbi:sensor histidine kinase [Amycolatopsis regifaucium]|uniref:Anti-sigma regulatory factor n=1 Tax=Amycolatopsis regifaucium TaxID=546365 RepID=A0A154MGH6_9PSEU|nr:sensor histidine kinase [Amycolatopsis regifaucium]KZB83571.1 anti-sigma regulatory factor [Amycolatopsis regifaucium]OKA03377.1 anti-sigma regulatory factor [Amycolatopsis regifaucium]